jgi:hypothetical protein
MFKYRGFSRDMQLDQLATEFRVKRTEYYERILMALHNYLSTGNLFSQVELIAAKFTVFLAQIIFCQSDVYLSFLLSKKLLKQAQNS